MAETAETADSHTATVEELGVAMLLAGRKVSEVARETGRSERAVRRWRQRPVYREAMRARVDEIRDRLATMADKALSGFEERVLDDDEVAAPVRITAFREAMRAFVAVSELAVQGDVGERIAAVERRLGIGPVPDEDEGEGEGAPAA